MNARATIRVRHRADELTFAEPVVSIGGRTGVDVVLEDVMVADRHCVVLFDDGFRVRDAGSVTGTWVDGQQARPSAELTDGATIVVGTTRIAVAIGDDDGAPTLELTVDPQSFWWQKPGKGAFDNDPDRLVWAETKFGRFPALHFGNRAALIVSAVLLLAATFTTAVMEPLADPGPLQPTHATVAAAAQDGAAARVVHAGFRRCVELAAEQGCDVCHVTGAGTPEAQCRQCHGLDGEMAAAGSLRHPYLGDGVVGALSGVESGQQFCVVCHTDHRGETTYKAASAALVGRCESCHDDGSGRDPAALRTALLERAPVSVPPPEPTAFATYRFPHDAHLAENIDCAVCHAISADVRQDRARGLPDDPRRHDFADVPYETCASCHVPDAPAVGMTAAQRAEWRAAEHQWPVRWHGTDDGGRYCLQCHASAERGGATVYGPDSKLVQRGAWTAEQHAAERARYTSPAHLHEEQFRRHAGDAACATCHVDGGVAALTPRPARPFWHGLHLADGSLAPAGPRDAAAVSRDETAGCASCHGDLADTGHLKPANDGAYHWPEDSDAQAACRTCHREKLADGTERALPLRAVRQQVAAERRVAVADFPHDVHLASGDYGVRGVLAAGCFACHEFARPAGGEAFADVPRTKPDAADCSACHQGHAHVGGNSCQQCHPDIDGRSNMYLVSARIAEPPLPQRQWPAPNGFSHLSPGHDMDRNPELTCGSCHDGFGLEQAKSLGDVRVPDETAQLCRDCHLEKQFHWR